MHRKVLPEPKEFRPVTMKTNMKPDYMSEEFMERIRFFVDIAKEMGFQVWLYDEGGWPSGSACTQIVKKRPDLRRKCIYPINVELSKGMEYIPPLQHENFLACFRTDKDGHFTRIYDSLIFDGESRIIEYRCMAPALKYAESEEFFSDILHPDTTKLFLELTHEKYKKALEEHFGTFIPYMFDDEPGVDHHAWEPGLEEMFREEYGYDILDYLPVLTEQAECKEPIQKKALADWRELICKLAIKNFFLPIRDWCRANGIMSIGHLDGDHDAEVLIQRIPCYTMPLEVLRSFDVPGVDVIWRHIFPEGAGTPSFQKSVSFFPRFASSAAAQIGRELALTESMAVYGEGLTPSVIRYVFGAEAVIGINVFNVNSIPYTKGKIRPGFRPEKPGYENMTAVNAFLKRLSYLAKLGTPECSVALYMPCRDIAGGGSAKAFHTLGEALEKCNIYFDVIDDAFVREAEVRYGSPVQGEEAKEGSLVQEAEKAERTLCMGLAAYSHVFVPEGATLPEDVKEKLTGFVVDHGVTADMSLEEVVQVLQNVVNTENNTGDSTENGIENSTENYVGNYQDSDSYSRPVVKPTVVCENEKLRFMKRNMSDGSCMYFAFNESKDTQSAKLMFEEWRACSCEEACGRKEGCVHFEQDVASEALHSAMSCYRLYPEDSRIEKWSDLDVTLPMGDTAVFLFTKDALEAKATLAVSQEIPIDGCFTLTKAKEFMIAREGIQTKEYAAGVDNEQAEKTHKLQEMQETLQKKLQETQGPTGCGTSKEKTISAALGGWKEYFTDKFSGEAIYRTTFKLDKSLLADGEWILDLGKVEYTASVKINGKTAGVAAFVPHQVRFGADLLQEENVLEICVANTAANQTVSADVYSYFQLTDIGPYHYRVNVMERESLGGGLYGPVVLQKLE